MPQALQGEWAGTLKFNNQVCSDPADLSTCGSCCAEQYVEDVTVVVDATTARFSSLGATASCGPSTPGTVTFTGVSPNADTADCYDGDLALVFFGGTAVVPVGPARERAGEPELPSSRTGRCDGRCARGAHGSWTFE